MTVKKAIQILDWWIEQQKCGINKLKKDWDFSDNDYGITKTLLNMDRVAISNLETIKNELVPDYIHPKKMNDRTSDGQLYCMNCNFDL